MMFRYLTNLQVQGTSENYIAQEENNRTISTILPSIKKNAQIRFFFCFFFSFLNKICTSFDCRLQCNRFINK